MKTESVDEILGRINTPAAYEESRAVFIKQLQKTMGHQEAEAMTKEIEETLRSGSVTDLDKGDYTGMLQIKIRPTGKNQVK